MGLSILDLTGHLSLDIFFTIFSIINNTTVRYLYMYMSIFFSYAIVFLG